jgi:hypothetical protein
MNTQVFVNTDLLEQAMQATHVQNSQALVEKALQLMIQKPSPTTGFGMLKSHKKTIPADLDPASLVTK